MTRSILLSPHDDDSALFAAFTCMRAHPEVVVVTDSHVQPKRGEKGCDAEARALETVRAHEILECAVTRLGFPDDALLSTDVEHALYELDARQTIDRVYTPALELANAQHDLVTRAAAKVFGAERLRCYATYAKHSQYCGVEYRPIGTECVDGTLAEHRLKQRVLRCYESQRRINLPHFDAVLDQPEWLSGYQRLHLGCGDRLLDGWINIDRCPPQSGVPTGVTFIAHDITTRLPLDDSCVDYVFTEDVLEHLPPEYGVSIMNEIWRVLVPGGVMEHYVPNAGSRNDFGSPSHLSHWNLQCFQHFDVASHRWQKDRAFEGFIGGFQLDRAELLSWAKEEDGVRRAQSVHVRYRAVK